MPEFYNALLKVNPNCCIELNKDSEGQEDSYESEEAELILGHIEYVYI